MKGAQDTDESDSKGTEKTVYDAETTRSLFGMAVCFTGPQYLAALTVVDSGATVLAVKSGSGSGSIELTFKLTGDDIKYSGEYTDTVTFTVSVN